MCVCVCVSARWGSGISWRCFVKSLVIEDGSRVSIQTIIDLDRRDALPRSFAYKHNDNERAKRAVNTLKRKTNYGAIK